MTNEEAIEVLKDCELNPCVPKDKEAVNMAIKALEQEDILDKIRAEIEFKSRIVFKDTPDNDWAVIWNECIKEVLKIIDKYKAESEVEE